MLNVLLQMAALMACGVGWRLLRPNGLDAESSRVVLTTLVYYLLLPALVLKMLWTAPLGLDSARIAAVAAFGVLSALWLSWLIVRATRLPAPARGALILASAFPNATYLGLPVLQSALGTWAGSVAIQYDLFACTPLLLTVGMLIASAHSPERGRGPEHGERGRRGGGSSPPGGNPEHARNPSQLHNPWLALLKIPPLWAATLAITLNATQTPLPVWLEQWLTMLGAGVVPLMLIALGMSLRWDTLHWRNLPALLPVLALQLFITPWLVWQAAFRLGLDGPVLTATVLEAAMPSMVLGIVLCDRFRLDTGRYAAAVTLTTLGSLATLPLWFAWL